MEASFNPYNSDTGDNHDRASRSVQHIKMKHLNQRKVSNNGDSLRQWKQSITSCSSFQHLNPEPEDVKGT